MILKEVALDERPREKALKEGIDVLSNCELLALILRTGTKAESVLILAQKVLNLAGGIQNLPELNLKSLMTLKGIKKAKAVEILACIELSKRISYAPKELMSVRGSKEIYLLYRNKFQFEKQEKFMVLLLDTKHQIMKEKVIFIGSLNASIVHPREIYKEALACSSASIICIHNHPSGQCDPSIEDIEMTKIIDEAGKIMKIRLLDHIIIGRNQYYSFAEHGLI